MWGFPHCYYQDIYSIRLFARELQIRLFGGHCLAKYERFLELVLMQLQELLRKTLNTASLECRAEESTLTSVKVLGVQLHSAGLSLRETAAVPELFDVL